MRKKVLFHKELHGIIGVKMGLGLDRSPLIRRSGLRATHKQIGRRGVLQSRPKDHEP